MSVSKIEKLYNLYQSEGDTDLLAERLFGLSGADVAEFFRVFQFSESEMQSLRDSIAAYYFICYDDELKTEFNVNYNVGRGSFFALADCARALWKVFDKRENVENVENSGRSAELAKAEDVIAGLRGELAAAELAAAAELRTFRADIGAALRPQYRDFVENGEDGCTDANYAALQADLRNIFRSLKRLGVEFDEKKVWN